MYPTKITFRLQRDEARKLYQRAQNNGVSAHQEARSIVTTGLTLTEIEGHLQSLAGDISGLQQTQGISAQSLARLQFGLIDTLAVILSSNNADISQENARRWVSERFNEQL